MVHASVDERGASFVPGVPYCKRCSLQLSGHKTCLAWSRSNNSSRYLPSAVISGCSLASIHNFPCVVYPRTRGCTRQTMAEHVVPMPRWSGLVGIARLVIALLVLIFVATAAGLGSHASYAAFGLTLFTVSAQLICTAVETKTARPARPSSFLGITPSVCAASLRSTTHGQFSDLRFSASSSGWSRFHCVRNGPRLSTTTGTLATTRRSEVGRHPSTQMTSSLTSTSAMWSNAQPLTGKRASDSWVLLRVWAPWNCEFACWFFAPGNTNTTQLLIRRYLGLLLDQSAQA